MFKDSKKSIFLYRKNYFLKRDLPLFFQQFIFPIIPIKITYEYMTAFCVPIVNTSSVKKNRANFLPGYLHPG